MFLAYGGIDFEYEVVILSIKNQSVLKIMVKFIKLIIYIKFQEIYGGVNMKKLKLTKVIASSLVVSSVLALNPIGASASWKQNNIGWWYIEGSSWATGWRYINGEWYYFDNNGYMKTGWIQYVNKWYYLYDSGSMAKNTTINGYVLDSDGAWIQTTQNNSSSLEKDEKLAEYYVETGGYKITNNLGAISKITLEKSMFDDGQATNEQYKKIWSVVEESDKGDCFGKQITTYGFTVKNHPLEKTYKVDTNVYIMISDGGVIGGYSIPNNGSTNNIYSFRGKTAEEVKADSEVCVAKPVIYLYPKEKTDISVNLDFNGKITCIYPKYNKDNTWEVTAYPDGKIINKLDNREYSYLYWEGISDKKYDLSKGFVIKGEDTAEFLQEKLKYLGLTPRESDDFITYWLPKMNQNKYNLISFQKQAYTDLAKLNISPSPDSILRIFMVFKPLDNEIEVQKQELEAFNREGFTVVEWGGTEIN